MEPASYPFCRYTPGGPPATDPDLDTPAGPGGQCARFTHGRVRPPVVDELVAFGATVQFWWLPPSWAAEDVAAAEVAAERIAAQIVNAPTPGVQPPDPEAYGDLYYAVGLPAGADLPTAVQVGFIAHELAWPGAADPPLALNVTTTATGRVVLFGGLY